MIDLTTIRNRLNQRLAVVETRAESTGRQATHRDEAVPADFAEQATARENDEVLGAISTESEKEVRDIRQALKRLDNDEYGFCSQCGELISEARLVAIPEATLCYACANKREIRSQKN
ncbi:MAG: TraR/DksA family transcriptional regulator [Oceanobacter sp.]